MHPPLKWDVLLSPHFQPVSFIPHFFTISPCPPFVCHAARWRKGSPRPSTRGRLRIRQEWRKGRREGGREGGREAEREEVEVKVVDLLVLGRMGKS